MNNIRLLLLTVFILNSALSIAQQAEFKFKDKVQRMGKILEGDTIFIDYTFTNVGDAPLIISNYEVACNCTEVTFPQEPILPGKEGIIKVSFDSEGKIGYQDRTISLFSNAVSSPYKIRFTISVKKE